MPADLSAISFVCAALLAIFLPLRCIRGNVANLAIVSWLIVCNIAHGVNAVLWAGNTNTHAPVWCDIVTKLLLGVNVALPGACVCIARYLELASSSREISVHPTVKRNRRLMELTLCYIFPTIYMSIHVIGQDHRFDLVKDLGCSASIHPSTPTLLIIWIPPLLICAASFFLTGLAIHNSFRMTSANFSCHISSRSPMSSSLFFRRVAMSLIMTGVLTVINLFSVFSISEFRPWTSWASVHARIGVINVISSLDEIKSTQLMWWGVLVVSMIYIAISLTIGEEIRDMAKWVRGQVSNFRAWRASRPSPVLPTHSPKKLPEMTSRSNSLSSPKKPKTIELKSGWDDMLDSKAPKRTRSRSKSRCTTPSGCPSPSPSSRTTSADDDVFMTSTLSYLGSPPAQTLGLRSPPPAYTSPRKAAHDPKSLISLPSPTETTSILESLRSSHLATDASSMISSVWDAPWPQPPSSVPPVTPRKGQTSIPQSPAPLDNTFGCPLYPSITPPHLQSRPFQGHSISSVPDSPRLPNASTSVPKRPSIKNLRRSREKMIGNGYNPSDVIYMTVVKETV